MMRAVISLIAAALVLPACLAPAYAGDSAKDWLDRMSAAMSQMTYQGTFVYIQGDQMETMRITHVSGENGVQERLVSLTGTPRELLRDADGVRWSLGAGGAVLADRGFGQTFFPALPTDYAGEAGRSYTLKMGEQTLIAGHQARHVKVLPRDRYRYGYSLWLEKHSGLLLKWVLLDSASKPLAKLMFTDLKLGSAVDKNELKPGKGMSSMEPVDSSLPAGGLAQKTPPRWHPERLPPGFSLTTHRYLESEAYEHLVYSDGLAAVSVYVESVGSARGHPEITQQHGTTHVFTRAADDLLVTVVGNVPAVTVQMIGKSVAASR
jgi:sigma-E factor negative regulatory protein RseB